MFEDKDLCAWLEDGLKTIMESKAEHICISAIIPSREVFTGYFHCDATDKAIIAHNINCDITLDIVRANISDIKDALDELETDGDDYESV